MRPGVSLALLGAFIVAACDNGSSGPNGQTVGNAETIPAAEDEIQTLVLQPEDQWVEPFDTYVGAAEDIPQDPNDSDRLGNTPLVAFGNGQRDADELPNPQNDELTATISEPSSDVGFGLEPDVELIILELVVRTQEEGVGPQSSNDIAVGGAEPETFSANDPIDAGSDQRLFTDGAQEQSADDEDDISDEQDFEAVSNRETIESDAERLKAQETERQEFAPAPLPERIGESNVALFALQTTHDVGTEVYDRVRLFVFEAGVRNRCAEYPDSEAAQQAFLDAGGPEKDELRIDPDGDGFVCGWDPEIYRAALK